MKSFKQILEEFVGEEAVEPYFTCIYCKSPSEEPCYTGFCSADCDEKYHKEWEKVLENNP